MDLRVQNQPIIIHLLPSSSRFWVSSLKIMGNIVNYLCIFETLKPDVNMAIICVNQMSSRVWTRGENGLTEVSADSDVRSSSTYHFSTVTTRSRSGTRQIIGEESDDDDGEISDCVLLASTPKERRGCME